MKKLVLVTAIAATTFGAIPQVFAAESEHTLTANVGVFSDYRFRGISQTYNDPALQGGFDYTHSSGFYLGNWNSNVASDFIGDGGGAGLEMDFYGGYRATLPNTSVGYDLGVLHYYYPGVEDGAAFPDGADTTELYVGLSHGNLSGKISYSVTDYFGVKGDNGEDTDGTLYYQAAYSMPLSDVLTLSAGVGYTDVAKVSDANYTDYYVGAVYKFGGVDLGAKLIATSGDGVEGDLPTANSRGRIEKIADTTLVLSVSKAF